MAVSCGTPTPEIILVVQIDPGPIPTLTASAPARIKSLAPSVVATFPAITSISHRFFGLANGFDHVLGMTVGTVHHQNIDTLFNQSGNPLVIENSDRRSDSQSSPGIFRGQGKP